ncbi:unnamed protein product [Vicia faba]|uniref:Uncharacterized protein n=1 Tax=Vicia faba TaxID=3906 RepID=A0AAV0YW30_VICFA|nr:unnamed protein product [Vicia faba]
MQSRLEEEDAKASLMSRIQRLTKIILASSKNVIPGYPTEAPNHQRSHSFVEEDKLDAFRDALIEQFVNDPDGSKSQIENKEREIQEKKEANESNEKAFELEIKSTDRRVLQDQLNDKCSENKELQEKLKQLEQQLAASSNCTSLSSEQYASGADANELKKKIQSQEIENDKL